VRLTWTAVAGRRYRIFAVPELNKQFVAITEITAHG